MELYVYQCPLREDFSVSRCGRVFRYRKGQFIECVQSTYGKGYKAVKMRLAVDGKMVPTMQYVHRLVLLTYVGEPGKDQQGAHLDGNPSNNNLENLKWCSISENNLHKNAHGTMPKGDSASWSKISELDVRLIKIALLAGARTNDLAEEFGVSHSMISMIASGKRRVEG